MRALKQSFLPILFRFRTVITQKKQCHLARSSRKCSICNWVFSKVPKKLFMFLKKVPVPGKKVRQKTGSKYNELYMWWKVCKSYEYSKAYILSFYKYKFFWWRTEDVLVIDLVLFMIETEYNIQRKVKLSCQCLKINLN